jgi:hypothetical protein
MTDVNTAQMVADLKATDDAVQAKGWVAPGLGVPGAPLGLLSSTLNPLGGLAAAGLSWFMPLVSFLGEGLTQLQGGNGASVTSGSQDFGAAGQDIAGVADSYRQAAEAQTSDWTGPAATQYRDAAAQHAEGIAGLGQAGNTTASAIIGAGQVVAQAIAEITELIAEAVSQIVPIMTQAIARAGETFGQSVVEAIPPCVAIAVEYALRIAAKLAALVASGDNLMKLVQGGMAVVDLIKTALSSISQQGVQSGSDVPASAAADQPEGGGFASTMAAIDPGGDTGSSSAGLSSSPSTGGEFGADVSPSGDLSAGARLSTPDSSLSAGTQSSAVVPPPHNAVPDATRLAGGASTGAGPSGAVGLAAGAQVGAGRGADGVRSEGRQSSRATGNATAQGGFPMGAMGGGLTGDKDKEHQRKYGLIALHDDDYVVAPEVISSD